MMGEIAGSSQKAAPSDPRGNCPRGRALLCAGAVLVRVPHPTALLEGPLIDRYDRFVAEIELRDGTRIRAHCVNPGRMEGQVRPGVLARHGRSFDGFDDVVDELADEQPALASCYGASVGDRQLLGASPGEQTRKLVHPVRALDSPDEALADEHGRRPRAVNIHVGPAIDGRDRKRLERLCRTMARPPVCQERLAVTESGQVVVRFKHAWRNGAHAVVLDPLDFIARLVALIPPPHFNMVRYHGVLAARAAVRSEVVPGAASEQPEPIQLRLAYDGEATPVELEFKPASRHPRGSCAELAKRGVEGDIALVGTLVCPLDAAQLPCRSSSPGVRSAKRSSRHPNLASSGLTARRR